MGRWCTVLRLLISIGTAYLVMQFLSIMDYVQALFSFFICAAVRDRTFGHAVETGDAGGGLLGLAGGHAIAARWRQTRCADCSDGTRVRFTCAALGDFSSAHGTWYRRPQTRQS
jgi:hypothetical protein